MQIEKFLSGIAILFMGVFMSQGCSGINGGSSTNHENTSLATLEALSDAEINNTKSKLVIAYGHTSHGSQITNGMAGLETWKGARYAVSGTASAGELELRDCPFSGAFDLGNPDRTAWESATRTYLDAHPEVNVVVWSWCGQVSSSTEADIDNYLALMTDLEKDYTGVVFVYMTGHLDGSGLEGNLHLRNEQIREYCSQNNKVLFDFADIESYDPDGVYYGDKYVNDGCYYDTNNDGSPDINDASNWAITWQNAHPGEWYSCSSAHSQPLNANMKAYAFWYLMVQIAKGM